MKPEDLKKLKEPFDPKLISWRVGATDKKKQEREKGSGAKATKGIALAYIDARDVMERLDAVCGVENWQCTHPHANGKTSCRIGIKIDGEWVWKENGAGDSAMDAEKGAFSDSFKRAAVLWGIGRYLYDVQNIWVDLDDWGAIKNQNDSRLVGALEKAAAGIRVIGEDPKPEPKIEPLKPVTSQEIAMLKTGLATAKNLEEFNSAKDNVRAAWKRLVKEQADDLTKAVNEATLRLAQAPTN